MSIERRLAKLEHTTKGRCLGCGYMPDAIRTVIVVRPPKTGTTQAVQDDPPQPGRPRCRVCGLFLLPVAIVEVGEDEDDEPDDDREHDRPR